MKPELYQRVRFLFDEAMSRPKSARPMFLQQECGEDPEVLGHVERLLRAHDDAHGFLQGSEPRERQFGRYRITEVIGRGAMGIVYGAYDPVIHRPVAIKVIQLDTLASDKNAGFLRERLFREAHLAGSLSHPGIVTIYDLGEHEGQAYIAMERIWGTSLQALLDSGNRSAPLESVGILRQIASALDYAHANRVVHRDVKPANILLQDQKTVKVVDFGIAKILSIHEQTLTGFGAGTPSYMSPEQIEGVSADGRSDQFSLAVIAFEMLTGTRPFAADSSPAVMHSIAYGVRPSAHAKHRALPSKIDAVFYRALSKRPEERYPSCGDLVAALASGLGRISVAEPGQAKTRRWAATRYLSGIGVLVVALCLGSVVYKSSVLTSLLRTANSEPSISANTPLPGSARTTPQGSANTPSPATTSSPLPGLLYARAVEDLHGGRYVTALQLFREAANAGDSKSMMKLGEMYSNGAGVSTNNTDAFHWYVKAADAGDPQAMLHLGAMYSLGMGVSQNFHEAAHWFQLAADAGNPSAMFDLGWLYENGQGVPKDLERAGKLYRQAATRGNEAAKRRLTLWTQETPPPPR